MSQLTTAHLHSVASTAATDHLAVYQFLSYPMTTLLVRSNRSTTRPWDLQ